MKPQLSDLGLGRLVFTGKVLGLLCGGQTNRVDLARRDGRHTSRRRTAATAGLTTTRGGHHKDDWRCSVRYSDDDCTPDSDDECGDEDRRI
jgi:hypothetical protein